MKLSKLAQSLQFLWFSGHVLTLANSALYTVSLFRSQFCYTLLFFGVVVSFGVQLYQQYFRAPPPSSTSSAPQGQKRNTRAIFRDVNFPYFAMALVWIATPQRMLSFGPYLIFSLFHTLTYTKSVLIPQVYPQFARYVPYMNMFLSRNQELSMRMSANLEIYCLLVLVLKSVFLDFSALVQLACFAVFIKLRLESSRTLKVAFTEFSTTVETTLAQLQQQYPANTFIVTLKTQYLNLKLACAKFNHYNLTNYLAGDLPSKSKKPSEQHSNVNTNTNKKQK